MLEDDDAFAEDLLKLQKALKFNRWRWLEAFNIDYSIKDKDYDQAIRLLSNLIKVGRINYFLVKLGNLGIIYANII